MINLNDLKIGDPVRFLKYPEQKHKIIGLFIDKVWLLLESGGTASVRFDEIARVLDFEAGDKIRLKNVEKQGEVIAVFDDVLWIKWEGIHHPITTLKDVVEKI